MIAAVIGAHYGDEGKGLVTDCLSSADALVVRYNGGAQAGHTVVTPEGVRHEFHHIGAGTFRGATTLLSRYFLVNPMMFPDEWTKLAALGWKPSVNIDWRCAVTTPFDILLNRGVEQARGASRHGSCGLGINETVTRSLAGYGVTLADAVQRNAEWRLARIAREYMPTRAAALGIPVPSCDVARFIERWKEDVDRLLALVNIVDDADLLRSWDGDIVFEGAQGLRLDEHSEDYPHVTRSRTGLTNVVQLLGNAHLTEPLTPYYVTRCYVTRHGAGPLPHEVPGHPFGWRGPETNVTNPHQGQLRYATLDLRHMASTIRADLQAAGIGHELARCAVTCLDQAPDSAVRSEAFDIPIALQSFGPTRATVEQVHDRIAV